MTLYTNKHLKHQAKPMFSYLSTGQAKTGKTDALSNNKSNTEWVRNFVCRIDLVFSISIQTNLHILRL